MSKVNKNISSVLEQVQWFCRSEFPDSKFILIEVVFPEGDDPMPEADINLASNLDDEQQQAAFRGLLKGSTQ